MKIFKESRFQVAVTGPERISLTRNELSVPSIFGIVFSKLGKHLLAPGNLNQSRESTTHWVCTSIHDPFSLVFFRLLCCSCPGSQRIHPRSRTINIIVAGWQSFLWSQTNVHHCMGMSDNHIPLCMGLHTPEYTQKTTSRGHFATLSAAFLDACYTGSHPCVGYETVDGSRSDCGHVQQHETQGV